MKRLSVIIFFILLTAAHGAAKEYPNWEGYPPMYTVQGIIEFKGYVFGTTKGGVFRYDPSTKEYKLYYKNQGLISNDALCIGATSHEIFIGFQEDGLWRFDPETEQFKQILFPEYHIKTAANPNGIAVRDICTKNDSILYIGHADGVDMLNLNTEELRTYNNLGSEIPEDTSVNEVKIFNNRIWVSTSLGLAVADEDNPNLEFAENWKSYPYSGTAITSVLYTDRPMEAVYVGTNSKGILIFDEKEDRLLPTGVTTAYIYKLSEAMGEYWAAANLGLFTKQVNMWKLEDSQFEGLTALTPGEEGKLWVGTMLDGLQCYSDSGYVYIPPQSNMKSMTFYDIDITEKNVVWCATKYRDLTPNPVFQRLQDNTWTAYDETDGDWPFLTVATLVDSRGFIWTALWGTRKSGLYILHDDSLPAKANDVVIPMDTEMEIIKPTIQPDYVVCTDLAEDKHGYVWVANYQLDPPDHRIEAVPTSGAVVLDVLEDFTITRYKHYSPAEDGLPSSIIMKICADEDGWVWLGTWNKGVTGIYVGDDPFDKSDTEVHVLSTAQGIHHWRISALAYDHEGSVWVGSEAGVNRIIKRSGHDLLVEDMNESLGSGDREIHDIEVDRFNNKWFATSGGLVKINKQNEFEAHFTTKNSGLFSDDILALKYNNSEDILLVGTGTGLNKFDVFGEEVVGIAEDIHVYPNPFEIWGYDSSAVFTGLKTGSTLRIYTFTGVLANELTVEENPQNGISTVTWNGRNFEGKYVGSGVYFFTGISPNGAEFRDKMVVIRR